MTGYKFTAEKVQFMGEDGYIVRQYRSDGQIATENFVGAAYYKDFCKVIGTIPEIV